MEEGGGGVAPQITYISSFDHVSSANNSCQRICDMLGFLENQLE